MLGHISAHWRGELSLERSILLSVLVITLFALIVWLIALQVPSALPFTEAILILALVFLTWASVGIFRCTVKIVRSPGSTSSRKLVSTVSLAVTLAGVAFLMIGGFTGS